MDWAVCKLQFNLVFNKFSQAEQQKVNKHPKFYDDFNIPRQLEHFEYEMNRTIDSEIPKSLTITKINNPLEVYDTA